jgi:hypothetical protein
MVGTDPTSSPGQAGMRWVLRWVLLAAVLAGIFGMHVLTADNDMSGHGALPVAGAAGPDAMAAVPHQTATPEPGGMTSATDAAARMGAVLTEAAVTGAVVGPMPTLPGGGHGAMAACILFLSAGAVAFLLALHYRRTLLSSSLRRFCAAVLTDLRRRGPPGRYRPRVALCVIRI